MTLNWEDFMGHSGVRASLTVTNVTDNDTPPGMPALYDSFGFQTSDTNRPRWFILALNYSF
jgi:hypothetical protein